MSLAARQEPATGGNGGGDTGGHSVTAAFAALTAAAEEVRAMAGTGSERLFAGALWRLAEATAAAEELAGSKIPVAAIARSQRAAAAARPNHLRSV